MAKLTKYKPEYCDLLVKHMTGGLSFEAFAGVCSVGRQTLYNWREKHAEFDQAWKIAIEKSRLFWEKKGLEALHDKSISPVMWIFTMKCRFKDEWGDKVPDKAPDQMSMSDLKILLEHFQSLNKIEVK